MITLHNIKVPTQSVKKSVLLDIQSFGAQTMHIPLQYLRFLIQKIPFHFNHKVDIVVKTQILG